MTAGSIGPYCTRPPFTLCPVTQAPQRPHSSHITRDALATPSSYQHDALGNRIKEAWTDARGAIDYGYLPGNYLVQRGSTSYSWGTYGQLILKDEQPNALGGETNYDYSARRLMTQVRVNGSPVAQFFYDPYGRRVKIVEGDTTTITLYSGNDIVYEVKTQPGQPTVTTKYLAINGKYLAKVVQEGTNQPQTYFYHTDLVGSVRAITDGQGQVVARFEYEPFGVTVQASGPLAGGEVHKFTGKPEDVALDLYYFNARYYDPVIGRFLAPDPERSGGNWYVYCNNLPMTQYDPDGGNPWIFLYLWAAAVVSSPDLQSDIMQLSMDLASGNAVAIGCDIVSILIPGVPAPAAKYAARSIERVLPSLVRRGDNAVDLARRILSAADVVKVTAWNYRDVFLRHNPRLSRLANLIDLEVHHVIPQRFRELLGSAVIDNYFNLVAVPGPLHRVITMEWEAWVKVKLALGEQIRAEDIWEHVAVVMEKFGDQMFWGDLP